MVGHRLPKKVDNRSQEEKDKERDYLISQCSDKDLVTRLTEGQPSMPDVFGLFHMFSTFSRAVNCSKVDGYNVTRFETEFLIFFYVFLNYKDLACCSPERVIDYVTSNAKYKAKLKGNFVALVEKGFLREVDMWSGGVRYQVTEHGYNYLAHFMWYMWGFHSQNVDIRRESFIGRMRDDLQRLIRSKPRKRGQPLPVKVMKQVA